MILAISCFSYVCNDLFSRFEQQTLFLEKLAEATDPRKDRHGHDGPSLGLISKHLENLKLVTKNRLSELCDGMAGRTVTDPWWKFGSLNSATTCRTDRRRNDSPSQTAQSLLESNFWLSFKGRF